jgi:DNA-directed RNA polymerase subunit M/transcription elongation factor TFIIS
MTTEELRSYVSSSLLSEYNLKEETIKEIEKSIYETSKKEDPQNELSVYNMLVVKIIENLKSDFVIDAIIDETIPVAEIASFEKEVFFPEKWQKLQDIRLPENIKKELKKGTVKCGKCGSYYTEYTSAQVRSADESSSLFFRCLICEHRWRIG